jgi:hypothetical protein
MKGDGILDLDTVTLAHTLMGVMRTLAPRGSAFVSEIESQMKGETFYLIGNGA